MAEIAKYMDISLAEVHQCYRQKDDLVEALFDRADHHMLQASHDHLMENLTMKERLHFVIMAWLDHLAPNKTTVKQMMNYKLEVGHIHLQILGLLRVSRTVQWFREAAGCDTTNLKRILEEIVLTNIYLMTYMYWLFDTSEAQTKTRNKLQQLLDRAEQGANFINSVS